MVLAYDFQFNYVIGKNNQHLKLHFFSEHLGTRFFDPGGRHAMNPEMSNPLVAL